MKSVSGGGMTEAMEQASVEVDMTVREIGGAWNVDFCMVWYSPTSAHTLRSGEDYSSAEDAIAEMKRRVMELLREMESTDTEHQVCWKTRSIAADGTVLHSG